MLVQLFVLGNVLIVILSLLLKNNFLALIFQKRRSSTLFPKIKYARLDCPLKPCWQSSVGLGVQKSLRDVHRTPRPTLAKWQL